tara:strand:- start:517 stop:699 length:183 start_codon:yes stop_codon:yes gene_type:complete
LIKRYPTIRDITRNAIIDSSLLNSFFKENFNQKKGIEIDIQRNTPNKTRSRKDLKFIIKA